VYDVAKQTWDTRKLKTERDDMFRAEDSEFLRAVAENSPVTCALEDGLKSLEVVLSAQGK
jgi:hypothetical protein